MNSEMIPSLIHLSTLLRSMGEVLDISEITAIGNDVLELTTCQEEVILAKMASETLISTAAKKSRRAPGPFRKNYDYGELWSKVMDDYRSGKIRTITDFIRKKHRAQKRNKKASYIAPIDSYCGSKRNMEYWKELLKTSPSQSVIDFIKYIKEVSCAAGD